MAKIKISYSQVNNSASEIDAIANNMKRLLEEVEQAASSMNGGSWTGEASDYFLKQIRELSTTFSEVYDAMESSVMYLRESTQKYQQIDQDVMKSIFGN